MIFKMEENKLVDGESTRVCPCCKQKYKTKIGLNNWKNLFRVPTLDEWITLVILILLVAAAYAYNNDTKACRETLTHLDMICLQYKGGGTPQSNISQPDNHTWGLPLINSSDYYYDAST